MASSYSMKCATQAYGEWAIDGREYVCEEPDFEAVKKWVVFQPKEFMDLVLHLDEKVICVIWDDAGYFLFSLDWYQPFVKNVEVSSVGWNSGRYNRLDDSIKGLDL